MLKPSDDELTAALLRLVDPAVEGDGEARAALLAAAEARVDDLLRRAADPSTPEAERQEVEEILSAAVEGRWARCESQAEVESLLAGLRDGADRARFRSGDPYGPTGWAWLAVCAYWESIRFALSGAPKLTRRRLRGDVRRAALEARRGDDPEARLLAGAVLQALSR